MDRINNSGVKQEQVLILEPKNELHFKGPFNEVVTSHLKLTNPSDRRVCFKVKTTAPKRYCVRPNNGIVEPHSTATIAVMLQPVEIDTLNDKNKHKFMVQTMFAPDGDINQDNLWKEANPELIMDSKLKCVFDLPSNDVSLNSSGINSGLNSSSIQTQETVSITSNPSSSATKPSVKASTITSGQNDETRKLNEENKRLREELSALRHENMQLKEDGLKHRIRTGISSLGDSPPAHIDMSKHDMGRIGFNLTPQIIAIIILMFVGGVLIGKILF